MPHSATVALSAFSAEKQMPRRPWPSMVRSLSLAVTAATSAPASEKADSSVGARRYSGSFIMTSLSAATS